MIDLTSHIRSFILADPLSDDLSTYNGAKAVFTRRPVDEGAEYPFILISPATVSNIKDTIGCGLRQLDMTYNIVVYGENDTAEKYRLIETIGFSLSNKFSLLGRFDMPMPLSAILVQAVGTGPFAAPTDDNNTVARAVSVTFTITVEL